MNKGVQDFWELSLALVPSPLGNDGIHRFVGDSSSWLHHVAIACCQIRVITH